MSRSCSIEGCGGKHRARGLCASHYARMARYGDPSLSAPPQYAPADARFESGIQFSMYCWEWAGFVRGDGYGSLRVGGKGVMAHRFSYERFVGPIPEGHLIDHRCHNKACVNPMHLRAVGHRLNIENYSGLRKNNTSGYHGVYMQRGRWTGCVMSSGKRHYVGTFDTPEEAAAAVAARRRELHTHNDLDRR